MVGSVPFNEAQRKENKQNKKISSVPAGNRGLPWNAQEQGGAKRERAGLARRPIRCPSHRLRTIRVFCVSRIVFQK